jgi:hypothetical protein
MNKALVFAAGLALASCAQLQSASDKIAELCARAMPLAVLATPIPVVGPYVAAGVTVGCSTAEGLSRLRADAGSAVWLAEQIGILREVLKR